MAGANVKNKLMFESDIPLKKPNKNNPIVVRSINEIKNNSLSLLEMANLT